MGSCIDTVQTKAHCLRVPQEPKASACHQPAAGLRPDLGYELITFGFAVLLLIATGLKMQAILSPSGFRISARWIQIASVATEWFIAAWLLSRFARVWARRAAIGLLIAFVVVAGWHLLAGDHDCGCFGRLTVHPAWTLALDVVVLGCIWVVGRRALNVARASDMRTILVVAVVICLPVTTMFLASRLTAQTMEGQRAVVLDSKSWPGHQFPLLEFVDAADRADLANGRCTVIIFDRHCPRCRDFLQKVVQASLVPTNKRRTRVIDIAPASGDLHNDEVRCTLPQIALRQDMVYFANVPLEVSLRDGMVEHVHEQ